LFRARIGSRSGRPSSGPSRAGVRRRRHETPEHKPDDDGALVDSQRRWSWRPCRDMTPAMSWRCRCLMRRCRRYRRCQYRGRETKRGQRRSQR
jgi:hypothetical protein